MSAALYCTRKRAAATMESNAPARSFEWLLCPVCGSKTRIKMRSDTELINFPLFCPKCRKEMLIHVKEFKVSVITEPDAQTQSR